MVIKTKEEITDWLRKDLQAHLDLMFSQNVGVEKYWEYTGKVIMARQLLSKMGDKVRFNVFVESKDTGI